VDLAEFRRAGIYTIYWMRGGEGGWGEGGWGGSRMEIS